jgi:hypothetical protein
MNHDDATLTKYLPKKIETNWWNLAKLVKKKAPTKGREKETRGKDKSPGKQTTQMKLATRRKGNH